MKSNRRGKRLQQQHERKFNEGKFFPDLGLIFHSFCFFHINKNVLILALYPWANPLKIFCCKILLNAGIRPIKLVMGLFLASVISRFQGSVKNYAGIKLIGSDPCLHEWCLELNYEECHRMSLSVCWDYVACLTYVNPNLSY